MTEDSPCPASVFRSTPGSAGWRRPASRALQRWWCPHRAPLRASLARRRDGAPSRWVPPDPADSTKTTSCPQTPQRVPSCATVWWACESTGCTAGALGLGAGRRAYRHRARRRAQPAEACARTVPSQLTRRSCALASAVAPPRRPLSGGGAAPTSRGTVDAERAPSAATCTANQWVSLVVVHHGGTTTRCEKKLAGQNPTGLSAR